MSKTAKPTEDKVDKQPIFPERTPLAKPLLEKETFLESLLSNFERKKELYFSAEEQISIESRFFIFDRNEDGYLEFNELLEFLESMGLPTTEIDLYRFLYDRLSSKNEGKGIDIDQSKIILSKEKKEKDTELILQEAFSYLKNNKNENNESQIMRKLLRDYGFKYNDEQIELIMRELDPKNEGQLLIEDFIRKMITRNIAKKGNKKK